jgi:hypothetical protein
MFSKKYRIVAPALVILLLLAVLLANSVFSAARAKAFAYITVEVNPEITMTVDSNDKVIAVELKNEDAKQIFSIENLIGKNFDEALKLIADGLDKNGFLSDDNQLFFIVQPAEGVKKEALSGVSERILTTLKVELETRKTQPVVEIVLVDSTGMKAEQNAQNSLPEDDDANTDTLSNVAAKTLLTAEAIKIDDPATWNRIIKDAFKDMLAAGFTEVEALDILKNAALVNPESREIYEIASGFVDMKDVGIPYNVSKQIFEMGQGIEQNIFQKEISTLISDLIDMNEVGISNETGLKALVIAIGADRSLKEISTIISGIIDLKEAGLPETELLSRAALAIEADPTLRNFDDLLGIKDDYDDDSHSDKPDDSDVDDTNNYDDEYGDGDNSSDDDDGDDSGDDANDSDDDNDANDNPDDDSDDDR